MSNMELLNIISEALDESGLSAADALRITAYHGRVIVENAPEPHWDCPYCGEERREDAP